MKFKYILIGLVLVCSSYIEAQWSAGGSYNIRSEIPKYGFGLRVERKLPFQFPDFGVSVRFEYDYYQLSYKENPVENKSYFAIDNLISLQAIMYPKYIQPYAGLGIGIGHILIERVNGSGKHKFKNEIEKFVFALTANGGVTFSILDKFVPYAEFQVVNYLGGFQFNGYDPLIKKFQTRGVFGILISM